MEKSKWTSCDITGTIQHSSRDPDYTTKQATEKIKIIRSGRRGKSVLICRLTFFVDDIINYIENPVNY